MIPCGEKHWVRKVEDKTYELLYKDKAVFCGTFVEALAECMDREREMREEDQWLD